MCECYHYDYWFILCRVHEVKFSKQYLRIKNPCDIISIETTKYIIKLKISMHLNI